MSLTQLGFFGEEEKIKEVKETSKREIEQTSFNFVVDTKIKALDPKTGKKKSFIQKSIFN